MTLWVVLWGLCGVVVGQDGIPKCRMACYALGICFWSWMCGFWEFGGLAIWDLRIRKVWGPWKSEGFRIGWIYIMCSMGVGRLETWNVGRAGLNNICKWVVWLLRVFVWFFSAAWCSAFASWRHAPSAHSRGHWCPHLPAKIVVDSTNTHDARNPT